MQANGGTLVLNSGTYDNTSGTIQALSGSKVQIIGNATISGGTISGTGSGVIEIQDKSLLSNLTLQGNLEIPNARRGDLVGLIVNNGVLKINGTINNTLLVIRGDTTLTGSGQLVLSDAAVNYVTGLLNTYRLTNAADHSIRGSHGLGNNSMALTNQGLIEANQLHPLYIDPTNNQTVINSGIMQANGGTLVLNSGTYDNSSGTIQALSGSKVQIVGNAAISGGTISGTGSGVIEIQDNSLLSNLTLQGNLEIPNARRGDLVGRIVNNGVLKLNGTVNNTLLIIRGDTTLTGDGELVLSDAAINYVYGAANTYCLTNAADHTIRGSHGLGNNNMALTNYGLIQADQSKPLYIDPTDNQTVFNYGTMQASGKGTLNFNYGLYENSGTIAAHRGGTVNVPATVILTNYNAAADTLTGGNWQVLADPNITTLNLVDRPIVINAAAITLSGPNSVFNAVNPLQNNQGAFHLLNGRNFTTAADLHNYGTIRVGPGSHLTINGDYYDAAGALVQIDGDLTLTDPNITITGALGGNGSVNNPVYITAAAYLSPGDSTGILTCQELTLADDAVYVYEVSQTQSDRVMVTGDLNFGTTAVLNVVQFGSFEPLTGDYVLFEVGSAIDTLPDWTINLPVGWTSDGLYRDGNQIILANLNSPQTFTGDLNWDHKVNVLDLAHFASHWLERNCSELNDYCSRCDILIDGTVNFHDYTLLASYWLR
ncbi:MAG: hypothetical protein AMJ79_05495 [Phycisphaerae bacterium SM23_30]|nr:MAG: hypothetical protein AMJ79_05495 [Phycisphaerae bacterium SM23_30]